MTNGEKKVINSILNSFSKPFPQIPFFFFFASYGLVPTCRRKSEAFRPPCSHRHRLLRRFPGYRGCGWPRTGHRLRSTTRFGGGSIRTGYRCRTSTGRSRDDSPGPSLWPAGFVRGGRQTRVDPRWVPKGRTARSEP